MWNLICVIALCTLCVESIEAVNCTKSEILNFQKFVGVKPNGTPVFVYHASDADKSLAEPCLSRCRNMTSCTGVVIGYSSRHCMGYESSNSTLKVDFNMNYYVKICVSVPDDCKTRWWTIETSPGYQLHPEGRNVKLIINITADECARSLLQYSNDTLYRSAQWTLKGKSYEMNPDELTLSSITGSCVLNIEDKYTEPESYRVANYLTLYMENQCLHDFPTKIERCSYEEYFNQTLKHTELSIKGYSKSQCKTACELEDHFVCRGFTSAMSKDQPHCILHSVDILTHGSWILKQQTGATYYRRVTCLNITIECGSGTMLIKYKPKGLFHGRMYVTGRADRCTSVIESGTVVLKLPLDGGCDVNYAYALNTGPKGDQNKTMAFVMLVIQNNPIIQTQGDRWIRVGCSLPPNEITLDTSLSINVHTLQSSATISGNETSSTLILNSANTTTTANRQPQVIPSSAIINVTVPTPPLLMYVVSDGKGDGVALGEPVELRVETPVAPDVSEIKVYHLVASSLMGDSSVLLIDGRGCTTGQVDFPSFTSTYVNGTQRLSSRFKAFRFPNSHVVRFAVMVKFCKGACDKVNCEDGISKNRTARGASTSMPGSNRGDTGIMGDAAWISQPVRDNIVQLCGSETDRDSKVLELSLVVGSGDYLTADRLLTGDNYDDLSTSTHLDSNNITGGIICIHELLIIVAIIVWLFIQILLLVGCLIMVKRYREFARNASHKDYQSFDNVGFDGFTTGQQQQSLQQHHQQRRVHWPDQNVDILHVT